MEPRPRGARVARPAARARSSRCPRTGSRTARSRRSTTRPPRSTTSAAFPPELYAMRYPAPGDPALAAAGRGASRAARRRTAAASTTGRGPSSTGCIPAADVPVVQLSLDVRATAGEHLALGRALAPLRDEGVLILASGNLTHDLQRRVRAAAPRRRRRRPTGPRASTRTSRGRSRRATRRGSSAPSTRPTAAARIRRPSTGSRSSTPSGRRTAERRGQLSGHGLRPRVALDALRALRLTFLRAARQAAPWTAISPAREAASAAASTSSSSSSRFAASRLARVGDREVEVDRAVPRLGLGELVVEASRGARRSRTERGARTARGCAPR